VEHRVEPPSWLPEGAAPEGGSRPAPGDRTVSTGTGADRPPYTNGQDGTATYAYTYDSSYTDSNDGARKGNEQRYYGDRETADGGQRHEQAAPAQGESIAAAYQAELGREHDPDAEPTVRAGSPAAAPGAASGQQAAPYRSYSASAGSYGPSPGMTATAGNPGVTVRPKSPASARRAANLVIARVEPWSVMKFSFLVSLVAWIVLFVAVAILYYALSGLGVFAALQRTLSNVTSSQGSAGVNLTTWTSAPRVLGYTMLIGAVNVVLITALSTVGAMIYNLVTHLGGGIEVTLKETD
jgi:hypothetical protein